MNRFKYISAMSLLSVGIATGAVDRTHSQKENKIIYGGSLFSQKLPPEASESYPVWNPGSAACPLHPTNAVELARKTLGNTVPGIRVKPEPDAVALRSLEEHWYYDVQLAMASTNAAPGVWVGRANVFVGVDGIVPEFKTTKSSRRFGGGFRRASNPQSSTNLVQLTPEEQVIQREKTRERLRQYQMEVIRAGMAPLPIPLTYEMDEQLVREGVLPSRRATTNAMPRRFGNGFWKKVPASPPPQELRELTPAQEKRKRDEVQKALQKHQMELILTDKPLLPVLNAKLTASQKKQLEEKGILFLADGSISNTVTGFCHPPRPGVVAE